jgi:hypothetical protein
MLPLYLVVIFPRGFPVKELHTNLFTLPMHSICPADLIIFDLIPLIIIMSSTNYEPPEDVVSFPVLFLGSKCFLTFNLRSPLRARSKSTYPHRKKIEL